MFRTNPVWHHVAVDLEWQCCCSVFRWYCQWSARSEILAQSQTNRPLSWHEVDDVLLLQIFLTVVFAYFSQADPAFWQSTSHSEGENDSKAASNGRLWFLVQPQRCTWPFAQRETRRPWLDRTWAGQADRAFHSSDNRQWSFARGNEWVEIAACQATPNFPLWVSLLL